MAFEYRYREGVHGEHLIDYGQVEFVRKFTLAQATTMVDAQRIVVELNALLETPPAARVT